METSLFRNWWLLTINGIAAIIFGLLAIFWPGITLLILFIYFGILAVFTGMFFIIGGLLNYQKTELWDFWLFEGVLNISIGAIILAFPEVSVKLFLILIGLWALLTGFIQIISAIKLRSVIPQYYIYVINGLLALIFGLLIILNPFETALVLTVFIGTYAVVLGIFSIVISLKMRKEVQRQLL